VSDRRPHPRPSFLRRRASDRQPEPQSGPKDEKARERALYHEHPMAAGLATLVRKFRKRTGKEAGDAIAGVTR